MKIMLANFTRMVGDSGGLAKVTCSFANEMNSRGHDVSLVYSDEKSGEFFFDLAENINCYDLRFVSGARIKYPSYLKVYREIVRAFDVRKGRTVNNFFFEKYVLKNLEDTINKVQPDIIISFQPAASKSLLCDLKISIPVITMSHGDPEDYFQSYPLKEIPSLEASALCQVLLPSFEQHLKNHLPNVKTITIGNAVSQFEVPADLAAEKKHHTIVFIGRLVRNHKRPHLLIEAFKKIADKYPGWQVELWGSEGGKQYYKHLEQMISKFDLKDRVFLKGATTDVPSVLKNGDIFAFPSAYEGFGLALAEAMSMGLPAIGYKNCVAVNELIVNNENGFLCEDGVDDFSEKLKMLMSSNELRVKMGMNAHLEMKK